MKKDSVASSALVTPTEEHRARFKGSQALTGGNRAGPITTLLQGRSLQVSQAPLPTGRPARVGRTWPRPQVRAQGLRRRPSCRPLRYMVPSWGRQSVTDSTWSAGSLCGCRFWPGHSARRLPLLPLNGDLASRPDLEAATSLLPLPMRRLPASVLIP